MKRMHCVALAVATLTVVSAVEAQANKISEVVSARANARAGGPLNEHDVWLLERYGALSGTPYYSYQYKRSDKRRYKSLRRHRRGYRY